MCSIASENSFQIMRKKRWLLHNLLNTSCHEVGKNTHESCFESEVISCILGGHGEQNSNICQMD